MNSTGSKTVLVQGLTQYCHVSCATSRQNNYYISLIRFLASILNITLAHLCTMQLMKINQNVQSFIAYMDATWVKSACPHRITRLNLVLVCLILFSPQNIEILFNS